jgi:glycosyltransferase involved in cell wall biosynthesis
MRVAIVTQGFLVGGGVPTIVAWIKGGLEGLGHEVVVHDLAASSKDVLSRRALAPETWLRGLSSEQVPEVPNLIQWGADWVEFESQRYRPRVALTKALNTYDLIQVVAGAPALALATREAKPPKVLQVATTLLMERRAQLPGMSPVKRLVKSASLPRLHRLEVEALRCMDEVIVENRWMENWVREQGQSRVTLAPPGIDIDFFQNSGRWNRSGPIIAFGRLGDSRKDWPTAVEAFEYLVELSGLDVRMVLAGRGPQSPSLLRRLSQSPMKERIEVREDIPKSELPALLSSGSLFLQSSLEEGLGLAGLEAMACGLPMVATRTAGSSEYVMDGDNGYLVDHGPGAAMALAAAMERVLRGPGPAMSARAAQTSREGYSSTSALNAFVDAYRRARRDSE